MLFLLQDTTVLVQMDILQLHVYQYQLPPSILLASFRLLSDYRLALFHFYEQEKNLGKNIFFVLSQLKLTSMNW